MNFDSTKILGCLFGGAAGDAVGATFEGSSSPRLSELSNRLSITDDTQLTLATCEAIIESKGVSPAAIANRFAAWFRQRRLTGLGASTFKALQELEAGGHWGSVGATGERAAGNGAAMRIAPLAFLLNPDDDLDRRTIRDVCRITHRHEEAYIGGLAIVRVIRFGLIHGLLSGDLLEQLIFQLPDSNVRDRLQFIQQESPSPAEYVERYSASGFVADSVPLAILAAIQFPDFSTMSTELISLGGDTDSNAAMAGQILGATYGIEVIPSQIINRLEDTKEIRQVAEELSLMLSGRRG